MSIPLTLTRLSSHVLQQSHGRHQQPLTLQTIPDRRLRPRALRPVRQRLHVLLRVEVDRCVDTQSNGLGFRV